MLYTRVCVWIYRKTAVTYVHWPIRGHQAKRLEVNIDLEMLMCV